MDECKVGDVYFYQSIFLKKENEPKHFHPVILEIQLGEDGEPKKCVVIITSYSEEKEEYCKSFGEGSYVVLETKDYKELSHKSLISAKIYEENENFLKNEDKKEKISEELLSKIKIAAKKHKHINGRIKRLL